MAVQRGPTVKQGLLGGHNGYQWISDKELQEWQEPFSAAGRRQGIRHFGQDSHARVPSSRQISDPGLRLGVSFIVLEQ